MADPSMEPSPEAMEKAAELVGTFMVRDFEMWTKRKSTNEDMSPLVDRIAHALSTRSVEAYRKGVIESAKKAGLSFRHTCADVGNCCAEFQQKEIEHSILTLLSENGGESK